MSTMNLSKAYFSSNQRLNHAAINPCFSLMESLSRQDNFDKQYRFMTAEEADKLFAELKDKPVTPSDSVPQLFTTERPNVVLIILESFSSKLMETLGGEPNVAINMDQFGREGILLPLLRQQLVHRPRPGSHHQWLSGTTDHQPS